jgi:hypothetical protein
MLHERSGTALPENMHGLPQAGVRADGVGLGGQVPVPELGVGRGAWEMDDAALPAGAPRLHGRPEVYRVVIKSATQMLKTETILNGIGYFAHLDPARCWCCNLGTPMPKHSARNASAR